MHYKLFIGNQAYSSWSLRGWLLLRAFDIEFECEVVALRTQAFEEFERAHFPSLTVPTLEIIEINGTRQVWDSLAIAEFLHEQHPDAGIWPQAPAQRAAARCLAAEMHSSYFALRNKCAMNVRREYRSFKLDDDVKADIARIESLWNWAFTLRGDSGPYLFGEHFCAADAFYAPVASRCRTYRIPLGAAAQKYADALLDHPATAEFIAAGQAETWVMPENEYDED